MFPELSVCGYPPRDLVEVPAFVARSREVLEELAAEFPDIAIIAGFPSPAASETGKTVMNSAALLRHGRIDFIQSKRLLPTYDVFDEMRTFAPAPVQRVVDVGGESIALTICEDAWNDKAFWSRRLYDCDPVDELIRAGGRMVLNISASPFHVGKPELRQAMLASIARRHNVPVLLVNQVGGNDSLVFDGSSLALNQSGEIIAQAKSFEEDLILVDTASMSGDVHEAVSGVEESAYAALVLGTRDYVRKCGFNKVVVGLSGGIDSALTAVIAVDALGPGERHRNLDAEPVFVRGQHYGCSRAGAEPGHLLRCGADQRDLRSVPRRALRRLSWACRGCDGGKSCRPAPVADC